MLPGSQSKKVMFFLWKSKYIAQARPISVKKEVIIVNILSTNKTLANNILPSLVRI